MTKPPSFATRPLEHAGLLEPLDDLVELPLALVDHPQQQGSIDVAPDHRGSLYHRHHVVAGA